MSHNHPAGPCYGQDYEPPGPPYSLEDLRAHWEGVAEWMADEATVLDPMVVSALDAADHLISRLEAELKEALNG